jgi:hypothetical protein
MRKTPLIVVLVAFGLWFLVKGVGWLGTETPVVFATPIAQPDGGGELQPVTVPRGKRACAFGITYGPGARYVVLTVLTEPGRTAGPLRIHVSAPPDYAADAVVPAGTANNQQVVARLSEAAPRELAGGLLCVTNGGRQAIGLYGIAGQANPSVTKVGGPTADGTEQAQDLSVTLLTSPSASLGSRLGTLLHNAAAFNPTGRWFLWIVLALTLVGTPIAVGVALGRALAEDDAADQPGPEPEPDSARR